MPEEERLSVIVNESNLFPSYSLKVGEEELEKLSEAGRIS